MPQGSPVSLVESVILKVDVLVVSQQTKGNGGTFNIHTVEDVISRPRRTFAHVCKVPNLSRSLWEYVADVLTHLLIFKDELNI